MNKQPNTFTSEKNEINYNERINCVYGETKCNFNFFVMSI